MEVGLAAAGVGALSGFAVSIVDGVAGPLAGDDVELADPHAVRAMRPSGRHGFSTRLNRKNLPQLCLFSRGPEEEELAISRRMTNYLLSRKSK